MNSASAQEPKVPAGEFHLVAERSMKLLVKIDSKVPAMKGALWFPVPGDGPNQKVISSEMSVETVKRKVPGAPAKETGKFKKPVFRAMVDSPEESRATTTISIDLLKVRMVEGKSPIPVKPLAAMEKTAYLASELNYEHKTPELKAWMKEHDLFRRKDERDVEFAARALGVMRDYFRYKDVDVEALRKKSKETKVSEIAMIVKSKEGECWTLSRIYSCVLRANGVPCRQVAGRIVFRDRPGTGKNHVKVEAFIDKVGWFPIEVAATVNERDRPLLHYFGEGGDYMVVLTPRGINYQLPGVGRGPADIGTFTGYVASLLDGRWEFAEGAFRVQERK